MGHSKEGLSISLAQISQENVPSRNLGKMVSVIEEASSDVLVFPETQLTGLDQTTSLDAFHSTLADLARRRGLWLVYGSYEREGDKIHNTARIVDRKGKVRLTYSKVNLWNEEGVTPGTGARAVKTEIGNLGLIICWDIAHPDFVRNLAKQGAEIIFCLSYWFGKKYGTTDVINNLPLTRAFENQVYIAYCDAYTSNGETAARSKVVSPLHVLRAAKPQTEQVTEPVAVDLGKLQELRKTFNCWPRPEK